MLPRFASTLLAFALVISAGVVPAQDTATADYPTAVLV